MSVHSEEILHEAMYGREALHVGGRLESTHLPLALTRRLMRDFRAIVFVLPGAVDHGRRGSGPSGITVTENCRLRLIHGESGQRLPR